MSDTLRNERNSSRAALRARGVLAAKGWLLVGGLIAALAAGGCTASNSALPALPGNGAAPSLGFAPGTPAAGALADAVVGNAYTAITVSTTGASGASNITCSANIVLPDGFSVTTNSTNCVIGLSGATVTGSGQLISFSLHIHDSGNGADLFRNYSINVHATLALAVNVDPGTAAGFAVAGRAYGTGAKTPVTFTATGGISPYIFTFTGTPPTGITCVTAAATVTCSGNSVTGVSGPYTVTVNDTGALPTTPVSQKQIATSFTVVPEIAIAVSPDPATNPAVTGRAYGQAPQAPPTFTATGGLTPLNNFSVTGTPPAPIACAGTTSVVCSGGAVTGSTAGITASISDNGNTTTPANPKQSLQKTITVNPILALTAPAGPPTAVNSRAYGQGGNCTPGPNCAPVAVGVAGGLGGYSAAINGTTGGGTAFACALAGANYNCSSANVTDTTANMTFALTTTDTANATTPAANSVPTNVTIAVNGKLALTPPAAVPAAVSGRAFGQGAGCTGGACAPLQYAITGGLGNYAAGTLSDGTDAMACTIAAGTYSCSTAKINAAAGAPALVMTAPETGNASTPSANAVDNSKTLTIDAGLNVASNIGAAWPVGVQNSAYGTGNGCSPGPACTAAIYTASNGISPYIFPATTPVSLPSGFNCATGAATYTCTAASVGASGNFNPSLTVVDTGDISTPAATVATDPQSTITTSLTVATVLTLTAPGSAPPTAVTARRYGTGANCFPTSACATIPFTVAGGTGNYQASISDTTGGGTAFTCPLTGTTYNCSTPDVADPAGNMTLALTTSDTGNLTTPGVVASGPANTNITVAGVMQATPPGSVPAAVIGRAFGTGNGCNPGPACAALQYTVSGGLGNYQAGTLGDGTDSMVCSVAAGTYSCSIAAIAAGAGAPTLTLTAPENGNASTPGANAIDASKTLTINAKLSLASSLGATWPNAVTSRAYGTGNGCTPTSACSAEVFTASNGIGAFTFPGSTPGSFPAGFNCASGATTYTCTAANVTAAAAGFNPSVTVVDAGNASTPAATIATDPASQFTANLTVGGALTLTPPAGTPATAVFGRRYGTGVGCPSGATSCAPIAFTVSGGAGAYAASLSGITGGGTVYTCPLTGTTYNCSAPNMADAATSTISLTATDAGNQSTPGGPGSPTNKNITVNAVMTVTPPASVPAAVTGRAFGTGNGCSPTSACAAIQYTITGGLGNYQPGTLGDGTDSLVCGLAAGTYSCSSAKITGTVSGLTLTMSTTENGNASTPGAPATDASKTLTIDQPLALNLNLGNTWPDAVTGRTFGTGSNCAPGGTAACTAAIYAASNGVSPYVFPVSTPVSFPGGFSCAAGASTYTCTSANVTATSGTFNPSVTISDTGDASTPAATIASDPLSTFTSTVMVDPEIVIQNAAQLSNGQLGEAYSVEFFCRTASICGGTGSPNNAAAQYTWSASTNNITGTAFTTTFPEAQPGDSTFAGTTTASGAAETVHITVADDGNGSTPSCASLGAPTCPAGIYTAKVLTSTAFVDATNSAILPVDTSTAALTIGTAIAGDATGKPNHPSVSANGTDAFITDPAIHEVYILDTQGLAISKKVTNTQGLANNAGDTTSVVVGPQKAPSQGGFNADSVFAYVYNPSAGSHNVQVIDGDPASGTFGTVTKSIALTNTLAIGSATGQGDIRVTPAMLVGATRVTRLYVLRPEGDEVCIIDAEPTSAGFQTQVTPTTHNTDNCIALGSSVGVVANFMTISPDGRFAFVSKTDSVGAPTGKAFVDVIDIDPNSGTRDTVLSHVAVTTASCFFPEHLRTTTNGQTVWAVCSDSGAPVIVPITLALVDTTQFTVGTKVAAGTATAAASDLAFRSDGALGVVTLPGTGFVLPFDFTTAPPTAGTAAASTGVTNPDGIDHIPDPSLNITTSALPDATSGKAYASSVVAAGLNQGYTFTDVTSVTTLASLGLTLNANGRITSANVTGTAGTYSIKIQVTDQSQPLPNKVVKTITININ